MALYSSTKRFALPATQFPVYDFLAPSLFQLTRARTPRQIRRLSSTPNYSTTGQRETSPSDKPSRTPRSGPEAASTATPINKPLTKAQRDFLSSALRVNQAGELAATLIYTAQTPPLVAAHPHLRPLMKHMHDQEAGHFQTFNTLLAKHRVRPTAMYPVWSVAATALGWGTALLGREAAMACTEAVETEIGGHYNGQVRVLLEMIDNMEKAGEEVGDELRELVDRIRAIRDEELEHLDHAVDNDAKKAVPHGLLTNFIRAGCKGAIWVSERV